MKTTDLFQPILLFALFLCGLAACNNDDDLRLSPMQETTMDGDASTLQIDLTRSTGALPPSPPLAEPQW